MNQDANKKVVAEFFDGINQGSMEAAANAFAEDATFWVPGSLPFSGTLHGRQAILEKNFIPSANFSVPGTFKVEVRIMIADGDYVVAEWITRRKMLNGRDYENHFLGLFQVKDGKIQSLREYLDTQYAKEVLFS
jgi:ketosteroid isomerase-like protein